ncbi:MAG: CpaF family protein [Acidimicrobiales bacterium]
MTIGHPEVPPLLEIERNVQKLGKEMNLNLADNEIESLRSLIDREISRWNEDHKRGLRPFALADDAQIAKRALRNLAGYGPLAELLEDDDVWEIMINSPNAIFVRRHRGQSGYHSEGFHDDDHVVRTLTKLLDDSSTSHRKLDPAEGLQDAQLDNGARLHIVHQDVSRGGHLMVNIRKFTGVAYTSLSELVDHDMLSPSAATFLGTAVRAGQSIVFSGAPGSGKTTMLSCCAAEIDPAKRVVIAEEVFEADVPLANVASMQTRPARTDRDAVDLRRLVAGFLRMAPDVAIVGEVRDREALPLLLTLSSGVAGFTTIHASGARQALSRLRFICQLADTSNELPMSALNSLVVEAIDLVVHCVRTDQGPRVSEIVAVEDLQGPDAAVRFTTTEVFRRPPGIDDLSWTGQFPARLGEQFETAGYQVRDILEATQPIQPGSSS